MSGAMEAVIMTEESSTVEANQAAETVRSEKAVVKKASAQDGAERERVVHKKGIRRQNTALKMSTAFRSRDPRLDLIGSQEEILVAALAAKDELVGFTEAIPPEPTLKNALLFGFVIYNFRPIFDKVWALDRMLPAFTQKLVDIGGVERAYLLISIARFDLDADGQLDVEEFNRFRISGEQIVNNAITGCANFAIISALLFGATHMTTMGRPTPFDPDPLSIEKLGERNTTIMIWVAYACNVFGQILALSVICVSVFTRQLLSNTLPSVVSKLLFLSDTNVLANLGTAVTWLMACVAWVVTLGGCLAVPTYGFISALMIPTVFAVVVPTLYPALLKSALRLHVEANAFLKHGMDRALYIPGSNVHFRPQGSALDEETDLEDLESGAFGGNDDMNDGL